MNTKLSLLFFNKLSRKIIANNNTKKIIWISIVIISVCIFSCLLSVSIVNGFKKKINEKISIINGDIKITGYEVSTSKVYNGINLDSIYNRSIEKFGVSHKQNYSIKQGVIKTNKVFTGILAKGIDSTFNKNFYTLSNHKGKKIGSNINETIVSENILNKLSLKIGDYIIVVFYDKNIRKRKLKIIGTYKTGIKDWDDYHILCNINLIRKINKWGNNKVDGIEVFLKDKSNINKKNDDIYLSLKHHYISKTVDDIFPEIKSWLATLNINSYIIISIMTVVNIISIVSFFLIIIISQLNKIGLLKIIGCKNSVISNVFSIIGMRVIIYSMLIGNLLFFISIFLLNKIKIIKVDANAYMVNYIYADFDVINILLVNIFIVFVALVTLVITSKIIINKMSPRDILRYQ